MFRILNGRAVPIPISTARGQLNAVSHEIVPGVWYVGKVVFRGPRFRVLFGNRRLFEAQDSSLLLPGRTGLWTKGRTTASFDEEHVALLRQIGTAIAFCLSYAAVREKGAQRSQSLVLVRHGPPEHASACRGCCGR